jgi:outer membrane protein OmpA-like peptidoglycan-associated protein
MIQHRLSTLASAAVLAVALAGCASSPPQPNADLEAARAAVERARADTTVLRVASTELETARQALSRAERAWSDKLGPEEVAHLSYLAKRRADIAMVVAAQARADERLQAAGVERDRIQLQARTREAERATAAARAAQASAQAAQLTAQAAQANAQAAQSQADMSRAEADAARMAAAQQAERAAALERDLAAMEGKKTDRGMVVTLGDVLFSTGSAELQPGGVHAAQKLAAVMKDYPERRVLVEGFTDSVGSAPMNQALSQRRAEAFRQALMAQGIAPERIEVRGHGEDLPVADNSTAAGRQQNRRVEVLFSDQAGRLAVR